MRTRLQGATRLEPLGDECSEEADARPRRSVSAAGLSATAHPAGRSGVPAGLITAGTDGTERNAVKWRSDGDRAGPTGALLRALFLATRPTPVGLLPRGLERLTGAEGTSRRCDRSERATRPEGWRGVCRRGVVIRWVPSRRTEAVCQESRPDVFWLPLSIQSNIIYF